MSELIISKKNEVYLRVKTEPHINHELSDQFTFDVEGAKYMPQYRNKWWDGKIRLFNIQTGELYIGLLDKLLRFCDDHGYKYKFEENKYYGHPIDLNQMISYEGVRDYMTHISVHKPREYQIQAVYDALKCNRRLIVSPTGSGKSLMIYSVVRYYVEKGKDTLIIVPTTSLVEQMYKDFADYGWDVGSYCHKIYGGRERETKNQVIITTWQSIYKLEKKYFDRFEVVVGDEAHLFKSKSLVSIMTKLYDAKYRFGFTGTLDGSQTHKWILEGLFGPSYSTIKTKELIKEKHLSDLDVKIIALKHKPRLFDSYQEEIRYLCESPQRNRFIKNLTLVQKGNTLVLFTRVETHGEPLFDMINNSVKGNRKVFFVYGGVETEDREEIRRITEDETDAIIVASYGTFSTGINIKNLHNVIFASPSKSRVRNLQSIGRVLRKSENKTKATLFDIADDITFNKRRNYTLNHLVERIKIYKEEKFNYEVINVALSQ
jgi:superfamily II DNA or RNA helicase